MKILYHHRTLGDGAEGIHVREMVRAFRSLGHEVRVIGPAGELTPETSGRSARLAAVKKMIPTALFEVLELGYSAYAYLRTRREIARFRPDFIYDRYITFNAGCVLAARTAGVPLLLEVNAPLALERSEQKDERRLRFRRLASSMERWICAHSTRTIVVSTPLREYLESLGVPAGHCEVMPNGVDAGTFAPRAPDSALRAQLGIDADSFVIGFTGVLRAWHGLDLLLDAAGKLMEEGRKICLLVVGDGPYRATMESMMAERGLARAVVITGRVAHERVSAYISLFNVAVSPRATFYASPMKVIEYMAAGKAVVVPNTQNFLDMIDEGANGLTFADGSAAGLATALVRLHADPVACRTLGAQAREKVERRLNWRWNAVRCCELVQQSAQRASVHPSTARAP